MRAPEEVFPEYYLIRVKSFDKIAENHLEEWIRYLKDGDIDEGTTAPGLREAKRKLEYLSMTEKERKAYDRHIDNIMIQNDMFDTATKEGLIEGLEKGRAEGLTEGLEKGRAEGLTEGLEKGRAEGLTEGLEKGEAIGLEKGRAEGVLATARSLKALGVPTSTIMQATGLLAEEIDRL